MRHCLSVFRSATLVLGRCLALTATAWLAACGGEEEPPPTPPRFTVQPTDVTVAEGAAATLGASATAAGPGLSYQWRRGDPWADVAGATGASLSLASASLADAGAYAVQASQGGLSTLSRTALLSVSERRWSLDAAWNSGAAGAQPAQTHLGGRGALLVDAQGRTHAVFTQQDGEGGWAMWAAWRAAGASAWGGFTRLTPPFSRYGQYEPLYPRLASDGQGRVVAVWLQVAYPHLLHVATFQPDGAGGHWQPAQDLSESTQPAYEQPPLVVAVDSGRFEIAWRASTPASAFQNRVYSRRLTLPASGAPLAGPLVQHTGDAEGIQFRIGLASDGRGRTLLAWGHVLNGGTQVEGRIRVADGPWGVRTEIDGNADNAVMTSLADLSMNEQGLGVLVMFSGEARVLARRFRFDADAPTWLDSTPAYVANHTDFGVDQTLGLVDAQGRVHIVSVHGNGRRLSRWRHDGSSWRPLEAIADLSGGTQELPVLQHPQAGLDAAGNLMVAWLERSAADWTLRLRRHHAGLAPWREAVTLPLGATPAWGGPALALQPDGRGVLLIGEQAGGTLRSARFE